MNSKSIKDNEFEVAVDWLSIGLDPEMRHFPPVRLRSTPSSISSCP